MVERHSLRRALEFSTKTEASILGGKRQSSLPAISSHVANCPALLEGARKHASFCFSRAAELRRRSGKSTCCQAQSRADAVRDHTAFIKTTVPEPQLSLPPRGSSGNTLILAVKTSDPNDFLRRHSHFAAAESA